jgi:hypothetical protein
MKTWRAGAWRVLGERELFAEVRPALEEWARVARSERGPRGIGETTAYFKGSPLAPGPALRHALGRAAGVEIPRLQEFDNLSWLRDRGFLAARPLLAGVRETALLPRLQFLYTEFRPAEPTLGQWLGQAGPEERVTRLATLARDVARLHRLGFVHRDLFPRNLLVPADRSEQRCVFLDAWHAGPGRGLRGPEYDLGCLFLDGAGLFTGEEQCAFLRAYHEESGRLGRPLERSWPARVEGARSAILRREARRRPGLAPSWRFPHLG